MTNSAFIDLAEQMYPFTIYYVNHLTGAIFRTVRVEEPGALHVPGSPGFPVGVYMVTPISRSYQAPPGYEQDIRPRGTTRWQHGSASPEVPDA